MLNRIYTLKQAAALLGMHPETLRKLIRRREIGHIPGAGRTSPIRLKESQIQEYIAKLKTVNPL